MTDPKQVLELCERTTGQCDLTEVAKMLIEEGNWADTCRAALIPFMECAETALPEFAAEVIRLQETVAEWNEVGEAIMRAVVGREAPLSDSDVIGEVARLRYENAKLRAVAEAAKLFTSKLQNCLDAQTCNINECYICEHDYNPSIEGLKKALASAGYGGEE